MSDNISSLPYWNCNLVKQMSCPPPLPAPSFSSCITFVVASSVGYKTKFFCYRAVLRLTRSRMVSFYNVMPRDWLKISAPFSQPIRSKTTIVLPHYKLLLFLVFGANSGNWLSDPAGLFYDPKCSDIMVLRRTLILWTICILSYF